MNKLMNKLAVVAAGVTVGFVAMEVKPTQAAVLVNNTTQGYYNSSLGDLSSLSSTYFPGPNLSTGDPTANFPTPPNLSSVAALGNWLSSPATTVNTGAWSGLQAIPSTWAVNTETAIIYEIDGGANGISNLVGNFGVDNGLYIWVNGVYQFGAMAPGGATPGEYNVNLGSLGAGTNYIQILREDHGGGTGYTVSLTGDFNNAPKSVPEPGTIAGLAIFGLSFLTKKKLSPTNDKRVIS